MKNFQVTEWIGHFVREQVKEGDRCIDATMGNGNDTLLLAELAGKTGHVDAFDIQAQALENTREKLKSRGLLENCRLILASHADMADYADENTISCIMFNLGYLPGENHETATKAGTTVAAVKAGLSLLKKNGLMTLCVYSGGDSGFEEKEAVLSYIKTLDPRQYLVICSEYMNRPNHPPVPVLIIRLQIPGEKSE